MMHEFLSNNSDELIRRCRQKVAQRPSRDATQIQLQNGVPMFLDQLIRTLRAEQSAHPAESRAISGSADGAAARSEMGASAAQHGRDLLSFGFTVDQVVHDYGDLCQAISDLAYERDAPFQVDEFRTLNRCLDNAIAEAVTEFSYQRDSAETGRRLESDQQHGFFVHELRNYLGTANLAFAALRSGNLSITGATGSVLGRSLDNLGDLVRRSVEDVRTSRGASRSSPFSVAEFIADIQEAAELTAKAQGCALIVSKVDADLAFDADRELLTGAVGNLLHNAFKFSEPNTPVFLETFAVADRVHIDVKDHCGGLEDSVAERIFVPFVQAHRDQTGLGLGLSVAKHSVELCGGTISVRNVPGTGCIFTISLPRHSMASA